MGIEYYLVKPEKKEVFYLGKHFTCPYGIANRAYKNKACFIDQDCFDDFLWDFLRDNSEYFNDLKLEDIKEAIYIRYMSGVQMVKFTLTTTVMMTGSGQIGKKQAL